ncbi:hypothetical protein [Ruegeria sp. 6PALISEP08]|uniref:hypothetical protein n=1 Tax=Ruegeria sp. 6PALISEP08 TaxID=1225660 RepID=UPI000A775C35|nr:hypothetical protein [Ruegeria sp. 6PALISEP08]
MLVKQVQILVVMDSGVPKEALVSEKPHWNVTTGLEEKRSLHTSTQKPAPPVELAASALGKSFMCGPAKMSINS